MATLSKDKVREILQNAPEGTSPAGIIAGLRERGNVLEGFEEAQPEARPVPQAEPEKKRGIFSSIARQAFGGERLQTFGVARAPTAAQREELGGVGREAFSSIRERVRGVVPKTLSRFRRGVEDPTISPVEISLRTVGEVGKAVGGVVGDLLVLGGKTFDILRPDLSEPIKEQGNKVLQSSLGQKAIVALQNDIEAYGRFKKLHPDAAKDIEAIVNISELLPAAKGITTTLKGARAVTKSTATAVSAGFQARKATRLAGVDKQIKELTQVVTQGKISDVPAARKALSGLDTTGVKTFEELSTAATDKVKSLSQRQTEVLSAFPEPQPLKSFGKTAGKGAQRVTSNPVTQALDDLDELYTKVGDDQALVNIRALKDRAGTDGITIDEVNKLAIEYGQEFGDRAFNPRTGVELTSVNAQRFESTRKSLKDVLRSKMPDEQSKLLDEEIGNLLTVRRLSKQMEVKVGDVLKKVEKKGFLQRLGRTLGQGADILTGRSLSGFFTGLLIRGGVGLKTLDALTIQKNLNKNLKVLDKLFKKTDEAIEKTIIDEVIVAGLLPEGTIPLGPTRAAAETAAERGVARVTGQLPSNRELFKTVFENQGMKAVQRGDDFLITRPGFKPFRLTEEQAKAMTDQGFEFTKVIDVQGVPVPVKSIFTQE